jgi:hypothetical protein
MLACLALPGARASVALADACGVPDTTPLWIDFAGHDAPIPAKPGMVLAVASGTETPAKMRAQGAATVFFDLNFNNRVGTPTKPNDPATMADRAKREYDYAVSITGCTTPLIAENELAGAQTPTPWSETNAQYRANVLALLQGLAAHGARPALLIANPPYTGGEAAEWWRQVAKVAILIRQVYFTAPNAKGLHALGPVGASRAMRKGLRGLVSKFAAIGIPSSRIALEMQFNSAPGLGARAGLEPDSAWFEIVKLEALAARQVATEFKLQGIWSWGWAAYSVAGVDPDKPHTACVWLWVRSPRLCNAPKYVPTPFDTSLTVGQLILPAGARCVLPNGQVIDRNAVSRLTALTGDAGFAASVLLERAVLRGFRPLGAEKIASAERGVIDAGFGGSRPRYLAALAQAKLSRADALAIITDRLARDEVQLRFKPQPAAGRDVSDFITTYAGQSARLVQASRPAAWLGGDSRGWVVSTLGPSQVFALTEPADIDTADGPFRVTPLGPTVPFALLTPTQARSIASKTLSRFAKASIYGNWLRNAEKKELAGAICLGDNMPAPGPTDLTPFTPFLTPS